MEEVDQEGAAVNIAIATASFLPCPEPDHYFRKSVEISGKVSPVWMWHVNRGRGTTAGYQDIYKFCGDNDVIVFMHDDVEIFEDGWAAGIEALFSDDNRLAIVGLGGASGIGHPDIYKIPYEITQLARTGYKSNQRGWEIHGERETGVRDVAVVDGFFMAIRTEFLDEVGGWSWVKSNFHCYDTAMCLMALRRGWKVKTIGLDCDHHGGGTSTKADYFEFCREHGTTPEREHTEPHVWQYDEFRDVLPVKVGIL